MKSTSYSSHCLAALITLVIVSQATAANLSSRPAGYVKVNVVSNQNTMVAYPFSPFDASIQSVLKSQLTGGTNDAMADRVFKFNAATMKYEEASKALDGTWLSSFNPATASEMTFEQGCAVWILSRRDQAVSLIGEVPLNSTNVTVLSPGPNAVGMPFTTAAKLEGTEIGALSDTNHGGVGTLIDPVTLKPVTEMNIAQGYWFNNLSGASVLWSEIRPYANVFPTNDAAPCIQGLSVNKQGNVDLAGFGVPGEDVDILVRDLTPTGVVQLTWGWQLAETVKAKSDGTIEWTDSGKNGLDAPENIFGRIYLLGSALDNDQDGVPDARAMFTRRTAPATPEAPIWSEPAIIDPGLMGDKLGGTNNLSSTNGIPVIGKGRAGKIFHVARKIGKDIHDGLAPVVSGSSGPKKTIKAALDAAGSPGDRVEIHEGRYHEKLNVTGRDVHVRIDGYVRILPGEDVVSTNSVGKGTNSVSVVEE